MAKQIFHKILRLVSSSLHSITTCIWIFNMRSQLLNMSF